MNPKLVRDRIPEIILAQGKESVVRVLSNEEYLQRLTDKLREETEEFAQGPCEEELCDVMEVVLAIAAARGWQHEVLEAMRKEKVQRNGAFAKRLLLEDIVTPAKP